MSVGRWAATQSHKHICPHHGPIGFVQEGSPNVLIKGKPAARAFQDPVFCAPAPCFPRGLYVTEGHMWVLVNGHPAARQWDTTSYGGMIREGEPTVFIGEASDYELFDLAIHRIEISEFGRTEEGKRVIQRLKTLQSDGRIHFGPRPHAEPSDYTSPPPTIHITDEYRSEKYDSLDSTARLLVHEGTHAANDPEVDKAHAKPTDMDDEIAAWDNESEFNHELPSIHRNSQTSDYGRLNTREKKAKFLKDLYGSKLP